MKRHNWQNFTKIDRRLVVFSMGMLILANFLRHDFYPFFYSDFYSEIRTGHYRVFYVQHHDDPEDSYFWPRKFHHIFYPLNRYFFYQMLSKRFKRCLDEFIPLCEENLPMMMQKQLNYVNELMCQESIKGLNNDRRVRKMAVLMVPESIPFRAKLNNLEYEELKKKSLWSAEAFHENRGKCQ